MAKKASMNRPTVVYWNSSPSPYVMGRMNAVARRGNLRLEAWFSERREPDRSWAVDEGGWEFAARYIPEATVLGTAVRVPTKELQQVRPDVLVSLYGTPSFAAGVCVGRTIASRTALRVLPTYDSWVDRSKLKESAKQILFRGVDAVKVPGEAGADFAARYGAPPERIHRVTQSIDVEHFGTAQQINSATRESERRKRGLQGCVFIYVGRLWAGKGLDTLFDAFETASSVLPNVSLLLVGDGVDEEKYKDRARALSSVHFEGFVQTSHLPQMYGLADAFVFPTLGDPHGLVVEEAMAAGIPVISSDAAGDIHTRLPDQQAGFIVPTGDPKTLSDRMQQLAVDAALRRRMTKVAKQLVATRSHDAYAQDFEQFIERTLVMPSVAGYSQGVMRALGDLLRSFTPSRQPSPYVSPHQQV